jgi:predicted nucleotidyltransferase component of viral defense system
MIGADPEDQWCHQNPPRFRQALTFTEATTGFSARLIEKDYFCSLVLHDLSVLFAQDLIFKGGTCLSKVHAEFFRLSEDLDFSISISPDASRPVRRRASMAFREHVTALPSRHALFELADAITGHNDSRQYNGRFAYQSIVTGEREHIKIEVSLREANLQPSEILTAKTLLHDPHSGQPVHPGVTVRVLGVQEAYAEKARAALTRKEPAIRDFFDIAHAEKLRLVEFGSQTMIDLVTAKLAVDSTASIDLSERKIADLQSQIATQLRPVLRPADYEAFDLQSVIKLLGELILRPRPIS